MKKKILAILTTACLVISMFPVAAFAEMVEQTALIGDGSDGSYFSTPKSLSDYENEYGQGNHNFSAKFVKEDNVNVYFTDFDNAIRYAYANKGVLYPLNSDPGIDGQANESYVGNVNDDYIVVKNDMVLDLSYLTGLLEIDKGFYVEDGASLTIKSNNTSLKLSENIKVKGDLIIKAGVTVKSAGNPTIEATGNANVTVYGEVCAPAATNKVISASDNAKVNLKEGSVVKSLTNDYNDKKIKLDLVTASKYDGPSCVVYLEDNSTLNAEKNSTIFAKEYNNIKSCCVGIYDNAVANLAGDVKSESYIAVLQNGEKSELNITGGNYTGKTAIWTMAGKSNIDASKNSIAIEATQKSHVAYTKTSDYPTTTGDAIVIENASGKAFPSISGVSANLVVKTGSDETQSVAVYPSEKAIAGFISAGTYDKNPAATYFAEGYKAVADNDLYKVVSGATSIQYKNVLLSTYVEKYVKDNTATPAVTVKVGKETLAGLKVMNSDNTPVNGDKKVSDGKILTYSDEWAGRDSKWIELDGDNYSDYDYVYYYEDNNSVGIAKVIVSGINNYTGTVEKRYAVVGQATPENLKNTDATGGYTVKVIGNYFVYNGQEIKPVVYVKMGSLIVSPNEYEISYIGNVNAGTATVSVESKAKKDNDNPAYYGIATFQIQKRNLYIIPDSYTKKSTDKVTFSATAYGYVSGDKGIVESYIDKDLSYGLIDKDSNNILTGNISDGELDLSKCNLSSGVYYIVFSQARPDNQKLENYNINVSAKGRLVILNANGTVPAITVEKTGNSLIDAINQTIENAKDAVQSALKKNSDNDSQTAEQTTKGDRTVVEEIQAAVKQAHEFWAKLTDKLK